ncbi:MAG: hypothetical protein Sylvanvirus16_4 [Sylvanvirus sp.]|uniref:Uncharacterized protein n=1 Tax=Sylvanvirus sp. TaxID=2487774 RepID=A0A3G5AKW2_9VIRU|nr:MAG: hypothetical protein Sylvanvirus16_4 [Sylvanvirus sp.]
MNERTSITATDIQLFPFFIYNLFIETKKQLIQDT